MKLTRTTFLALWILLSIGALAFAGAAKIHLKSVTIDTATSPNAKAQSLNHDYYIVQFTGPIQDEWKEAASKTGAVFIDYVPDFAYVVKADQIILDTLKQLPFIQWIGDFRPEFKISPKISKDKERVTVTVQSFPGEPATALTTAAVKAGGQVLTSSTGDRNTIRIDIPAKAIAALANTKEISWIEPYNEPRLTNQVSRTITNVATVWQDLGFYGNNQLVAVADTGLDNGVNDSTMSDDFQGRIFKTYDLGRNKKWDDPDAHGTHVCGSILGNGSLSGSNPSTHDYSNSFAGMAPEARLIIQSILDNSGGLGGLPSNLNNLFTPPYTDGARIHSNSWGANAMGAYSTMSQQVDQFLWNHKDMVIVFSAGNGGTDANSNGIIDYDSLDSPGTAKNCITVGASESNINARGFTYGAAWPSDYPAEPIKSDTVCNNALGLAAFSSRGNTDDGRIKPDICAPGTNIISARSHVASGTLWGEYDSNYLYSGGTSMSTPIVAGAAALLREYLIKVKHLSSPSCALVKAGLLNSATDMYPGQYGTGSFLEIPSSRPNKVEGWGRLNIRSAIQPIPPLNAAFIDDTGLSTGQFDQFTYTISNTSVPFKITLAWTDWQGATYAGKELVNDLDLIVTAPGGQQYTGNNTTDRLNNVETIDILTPTAGSYTIKVSAYNVAQPFPNGVQPYALAIMGGFGEPPTVVSTVSDAKSQSNNALLTISGKVVTAGTEAFTDHFYIEDADRTSGIKVAYTGGNIPTGSMVYVLGRFTTDGDEYQINASDTAILSTDNTLPGPLGIRSKDIGGLELLGKQGLSNTGLYIKTWGKVINWGTDYIQIDDGSGPTKILTGTMIKPDVGSFVTVTGISSVTSTEPQVKARFDTDVTPP